MNDHLAWTTDKPKEPGYYLVRGFEIGLPATAIAAVEVGFDHNGELCTNLHETNSDPDGLNHGYTVAGLNADFEWCPLLPKVNACGAQIAARETK